MPGSIFPDINPNTTSGPQLATLLNDFRNIVVSGFIGTVRPAGLLKGGYWVDNSLEISQGVFRVYIFDGVGDVLQYTINKTTGEIIFPVVNSSLSVKQTSGDAVGAKFKLFKKRIAALGQVLTNDVLGYVTFSSTDDTGAEVQDAATIESIAEENHTGTVQGTKLNFYTKLIGTAVKTLQMSINSISIDFFRTVNFKELFFAVDGYGNSAGGAGANVAFRRARGTQAAPTAVQTGDSIAFIGGRGHDGTSYNVGSKLSIVMYAAENHTPTANGTGFVFGTTGIGTTTRKNRFGITESGYLEIYGDTSGVLSIKAAAVTTTHFMTMPANNAVGALTNDGSGGLSWTPSGGGGGWTKYTIGHAALQAVALTNNTALFTLPIRGIVEGILIKTSTAFAGTGITSYNLTVGITGIESKYLPVYDADAAVTGGNYDVSSVAVGGEDLHATEAIKVFATSVGANLDQSNAGSVDIWVKTATLPA